MGNILRDERGAILLLTVLLLTMLLVLAGIGADLARMWVAREQAQTAVDAASLAGALNAERYVTVRVEKGYYDYWTDSDGHTHKKCATSGTVNRSGLEEYMIKERGWKHHPCDKYIGIHDRWVEYPANTEQISRQLLKINYPSLIDEPVEEEIKVFRQEGNKYYPSVVSQLRGKIHTTFLKVAGIDELKLDSDSQSTTFYEVIRDGWIYGRNPAPEDATKNH